MITVGLTLLLGLVLYLGLTLRLRSLSAYYFAVAVTIGTWASSILFWNSYTVIVPMVLGALGSMLLTLAGARAAWAAHQKGDVSRSFWLAGVLVVLLPYVLLYYAR